MSQGLTDAIIKVETDGYYKDRYVYVYPSIFTVDYAIKKFTSDAKSILKVANNKIVPGSNKFLVTLKFEPFPSVNKMIEEVELTAKELFNKLNIKSITGKNKKVKQALLLYDYLAKNNLYYMPTMEEVDDKHEEMDKVRKLIMSARNRFNKMSEIRTNTTNEAYKDYLNHKLTKTENFIKSIRNPYNTEDANKIITKSIYNTLIRKRGVCAEFSMTYQYLLKELDIKSYYVVLVNEVGDYTHALNVVEYEEKGKTKFFVADLTQDVVENHEEKGKLRSNMFGLGKEYLNEYGEIIQIRSAAKLSDSKEKRIIYIYNDKDKFDRVYNRTEGIDVTQIKQEVQEFVNNNYNETKSLEV